MLFDRNIEPSCAYCQRGRPISDREVACEKRGIVSIAGQCRAFRYDPISRKPAQPLYIEVGRYAEEDFSLNK